MHVTKYVILCHTSLQTTTPVATLNNSTHCLQAHSSLYTFQTWFPKVSCEPPPPNPPAPSPICQRQVELVPSTPTLNVSLRAKGCILYRAWVAEPSLPPRSLIISPPFATPLRRPLPYPATPFFPTLRAHLPLPLPS